jgi:hypothetical protein
VVGDYENGGKIKMAISMNGIANMACLKNTTSGVNIKVSSTHRAVNRLNLLIKAER